MSANFHYKTKVLYAKAAIESLYSDRSVTMEQTIESMQEINDEIEEMISCLSFELKLKAKGLSGGE